ncbi:hypothetical protein BV20DRAFT_455293 [Pilatotrama ljubarskyi]|nr:hypothetical protein BV20DRAFT_455293 [Pilatotrama ljubarskyi]
MGAHRALLFIMAVSYQVLAAPIVATLEGSATAVPPIPSSHPSLGENPMSGKAEPETDKPRSTGIPRLHVEYSSEESTSSGPIATRSPFPDPALVLGRGESPTSPAGSLVASSPTGCDATGDMMRRDLAGHGLPLTALVVELCTFLLLAGFVVYFFLWRYNFRRQLHQGYAASTKFRSSLSLSSHDASFKHTPPTPAQPSMPVLTKIPEDPFPSTPIQLSFHGQRPLSPHPPPSSSLGGTPVNPARSGICSFVLGQGAPASESDKKPSFLPLTG